ncbi:MAG: hypothetical protein WC841_01640 [Candidatus Shapirobacteria bacterium]|jgi:hypothetical protein
MNFTNLKIWEESHNLALKFTNFVNNFQKQKPSESSHKYKDHLRQFPPTLLNDLAERAIRNLFNSNIKPKAL